VDGADIILLVICCASIISLIVGVIYVNITPSTRTFPKIMKAQESIRKARQFPSDWNNARIERYNNLPALGKARVDKRNAQIIKYGGAVSAVGAIGIIRLINPLGIVPMLMHAYRARRNWKEQSNVIAEADKRREQILNPPAPLGDQASALQPAHARNYWDPN
jgi:hypothetical protein